MKVLNKFMDYRATQEHKLLHGVDGRKLELGDVNTINITMLNVRGYSELEANCFNRNCLTLMALFRLVYNLMWCLRKLGLALTSAYHH